MAAGLPVEKHWGRFQVLMISTDGVRDVCVHGFRVNTGFRFGSVSRSRVASRVPVWVSPYQKPPHPFPCHWAAGHLLRSVVFLGFVKLNLLGYTGE